MSGLDDVKEGKEGDVVALHDWLYHGTLAKVVVERTTAQLIIALGVVFDRSTGREVGKHARPARYIEPWDRSQHSAELAEIEAEVKQWDAQT